MQEYIIHALRLASYTSLQEAQYHYINKNFYYNQNIFYTVANPRDTMISLTYPLAITGYLGASKSILNTKYLLIIIICASMGVTLIGYGVIIPRILKIMKFKSNVLKFFGDITTADIKAIINGMIQTSTKILRDYETVLDEHCISSINSEQFNNTSFKPNEVKHSRKTTEAPLNEVVRNTIAEKEIMEKNKEGVKKKKEILGNAYKDSKRFYLLLIACFVILVLGYFCGSIAIIVVTFNNFHEIASNVRWTTMRQFAITFEMFLIREMTILNTTESRASVAVELENLYNYERLVHIVRTSSKRIYKNHNTLADKLNTKKFCAIIYAHSKEDQNRCETYQNGFMLRGMENLIWQVIAYLISVENSYMQLKNTDYNFTELLKASNWESASTFLY
jgi:hypothetical protein